MPKRGRVIVVGSTNTDLVVRGERLPKPGETVLGGDLRTFAGGKGANQAVAAARAGARVHFIGAFGDDAFGRARRADLEREGVDCSGCVVKKGVPSGVALIALGDGRSRAKARAENMILVAPGANARLTAGDVKRGMPKILKDDVVLCSLEIPIPAVRVALKLSDGYAYSILNPAPFPLQGWPNNWTWCCNLLTPNEHEFKRLFGVTPESPLARKRLWAQLQPYAKIERIAENILITRGARGILYYFSSDRLMQRIHEGKSLVGARGDQWCLGSREIRAPKVRPVDTVGAGDCFNGALAARISKYNNGQFHAKSHKSRMECFRFAVAAAALKVTRHGAQAGMPYRAEILRMMKRVK